MLNKKKKNKIEKESQIIKESQIVEESKAVEESNRDDHEKISELKKAANEAKKALEEAQKIADETKLALEEAQKNRYKLTFEYDVVNAYYFIQNQCHIGIPDVVRRVAGIVNTSDEETSLEKGTVIHENVCKVIYDGYKKTGALYLFKKNEELYFGWSFCSPHDQFSKPMARKVAEERAMPYTITNLKTIKDKFPKNLYSEEIVEWFQDAVTEYLTGNKEKV